MTQFIYSCDSYVECVQVYFRKFVHLNQLIVLSFDVKQKPHTLNIQILLLIQKCIQFIIGIKITLPADRDTLRQRYPLIYKNIPLLNGDTHLWRE